MTSFPAITRKIAGCYVSEDIRDGVGDLLWQDLHAKRVKSLCDATLGVLHSGSLAICAIGHGLAAARYLKPKHAIKRGDRLLSNSAYHARRLARPADAALLAMLLEQPLFAEVFGPI